MPDKIYMIYCPGNKYPRVTHKTLGEAEDEAMRIAKKTGEEIHILETVKICVPLPPVEREVQWRIM